MPNIAGPTMPALPATRRGVVLGAATLLLGRGAMAATSDAAGAGIATPGAVTPGTATSGTTTPGTAATGTATTGTATTGTAIPGPAAPGIAAPGTATPGTATPGTAAPGTAAPGTATTGTATTGPSPGAATGAVAVLHAGSLVNLMEHGLAPAFREATGGTVEAFAGGSNALANQIKGRLRRGDVFISASPSADAQLSGAANGDWIRWYVDVARSPLVLGFDPQGRFARALATRPWYQALQEPGLRIGRTDPALDPKGAFTVQLMNKAEQVYAQPGLARRVLGAPDNPDQVHPEPNLVGRLQSRQIDVGFFYSTEATDLHLTSLALPAAVSVSAQYTVAILRDAPDAPGAEAFVLFLLGPKGQAVMRAHGLELVPPLAHGDASRIPPAIRALLAAR